MGNSPLLANLLALYGNFNAEWARVSHGAKRQNPQAIAHYFWIWDQIGSFSEGGQGIIITD
jgi:hypothetical protein